MEHKLLRGLHRRKSNSRKLTTLLFGLYFLIPAILIFLSFSTRTVSAESLPLINDETTLGEELPRIDHTNGDLLISPVIYMVGSDHPFGLNVIEVKTSTQTYRVLTEEYKVEDLLSQLDIEYDSDDLVIPYIDQVVASNASIRIIKVHNGNHQEIIELPFMIEYEDDPTVNKGVEEVLREGKMGQMVQSYKIVYEDGLEVSRKLISEEITINPEPMLIKRGTKKEIPHSKLQSGTCDSWDKVIDSVTSVEDERSWLKGIMRCESGCDANRVSYNGVYHGLFQFHPKTFAAYGGTNIYDGNQQIQFAYNIVKAGAQYTQFPGCSR